ncbi:baseplate wedge subunit [Acinetobacter phage ZZ1]|uniref:Baseplate wedge subunit n=3 Tax=Caudoviricetes TaxID=2731619 RepID=A0A410T5J3_9CAUD|nr:baseplate wedge subunit [Acinetobacter phage ZZ1]AEJ90214.1 baseplate wedge subunit [Acinetobacter phage ZZ1]QAU04015.1 baseplate wedge subunit [Acinetobacter phage Henu6]
MINSFYDPVAYSAKTVNVNAPERLMTNIFKTYTSYFKKVAANYNLITYYIQGAPRPEALSYELYNNTQLYWALTMANDVYDPFHDWIKSQEACYQSVAQIYDNPESVIVYHVDIKGERYYNLIQYDDEPGVWYDKGDKNRSYPQYKGALAAVNAYEDALSENEKKREIKIIAPTDIDNFISDLIKEMERNLHETTVG